MAGYNDSRMNQKNVQDSAKLGHSSKSDIRYWQRAIFRQTYTRNGRTLATKNWAMKIAHKGRRETFPLGTPNRAAAATRARDIYLSLLVNGWDATLAKFKHSNQAAPIVNANDACTVGEFLAAAARMTSNHATFDDYARAFRQIVSEMSGLSNNTLILRNSPTLAEEMGTSVQMVRSHYDAVVSPSVAKPWWELRPKRPNNIVSISTAA
jgi:hypothetical protein